MGAEGVCMGAEGGAWLRKGECTAGLTWHTWGLSFEAGAHTSPPVHQAGCTPLPVCLLCHLLCHTSAWPAGNLTSSSTTVPAAGPQGTAQLLAPRARCLPTGPCPCHPARRRRWYVWATLSGGLSEWARRLWGRHAAHTHRLYRPLLHAPSGPNNHTFTRPGLDSSTKPGDCHQPGMLFYQSDHSAHPPGRLPFRHAPRILGPERAPRPEAHAGGLGRLGAHFHSCVDSGHGAGPGRWVGSAGAEVVGRQWPGGDGGSQGFGHAGSMATGAVAPRTSGLATADNPCLVVQLWPGTW